ncbi:hypothetical protein ACQYWQ_16160 [Streptomyces sp. P6-2-1]|uniref:hypothetical protein n=1 Tax=Streptomyces sp. P6-2-1 TaxID=3422591 RepID=UPI003D369083
MGTELTPRRAGQHAEEWDQKEGDTKQSGYDEGERGTATRVRQATAGVRGKAVRGAGVRGTATGARRATGGTRGGGEAGARGRSSG